MPHLMLSRGLKFGPYAPSGSTPQMTSPFPCPSIQEADEEGPSKPGTHCGAEPAAAGEEERPMGHPGAVPRRLVRSERRSPFDAPATEPLKGPLGDRGCAAPEAAVMAPVAMRMMVTGPASSGTEAGSEASGVAWLHKARVAPGHDGSVPATPGGPGRLKSVMSASAASDSPASERAVPPALAAMRARWAQSMRHSSKTLERGLR